MLNRIFAKEKEKTGVDKGILWCIIISNVFIVFIFACLQPVVFQEITPYLKNSYVYFNVFTLGINMVGSAIIADKKLMNILDKHFPTIVVIDLVIYTIISISGIYSPLIRLFGIGFINTTTTLVWRNVFRKSLNNFISGDELTHFQLAQDKYIAVASFGGAVIALVIANITNIYIIASIIMLAMSIFGGIVDLYVRKYLIENTKKED